MDEEKHKILNDSSVEYERAEMTHIREALSRSYKERFLMATQLYKIQQTMKRAVIKHKPFIKK